MRPDWADLANRTIQIARNSRSLTEVARKLSAETGMSITAAGIGAGFRRLRIKGVSVPRPGEVLGADLIDTVAPVTIDPELAKVPDKPSRRELEIHRLRTAESEHKKLRKDLLKELKLSDERLEVALAISNPAKPPAITRREKASNLREATAVVLASDWHVEETVDPKTINGKNTYNPSIAATRSEKFFKGVEWLINFSSSSGKGETGFVIKDLVLWLGGDMITGYIHDELIEANTLSPTEAILFCQSLLISGIDYLLANTELEKITVPCNYGNHGRTTAKRRIQTGAKNSFEWLMYHTLKQHYEKEERIEFIVADGPHLYLDVYKWTIRFHHGDDIRYWGGIGGLSTPLRKATDAWNEFRHADYTCVGHYHTFSDFGTSVVNGSLIGYNAFALSIKARFEVPRQAFFLIDSKRGKIQTTPVWVDSEAE
jgi:hypothetical protein